MASFFKTKEPIEPCEKCEAREAGEIDDCVPEGHRHDGFFAELTGIHGPVRGCPRKHKMFPGDPEYPTPSIPPEQLLQMLATDPAVIAYVTGEPAKDGSRTWPPDSECPPILSQLAAITGPHVVPCARHQAEFDLVFTQTWKGTELKQRNVLHANISGKALQHHFRKHTHAISKNPVRGCCVPTKITVKHLNISGVDMKHPVAVRLRNNVTESAVAAPATRPFYRTTACANHGIDGALWLPNGGQTTRCAADCELGDCGTAIYTLSHSLIKDAAFRASIPLDVDGELKFPTSRNGAHARQQQHSTGAGVTSVTFDGAHYKQPHPLAAFAASQFFVLHRQRAQENGPHKTYPDLTSFIEPNVLHLPRDQLNTAIRSLIVDGFDPNSYMMSFEGGDDCLVLEVQPVVGDKFAPLVSFLGGGNSGSGANITSAQATEHTLVAVVTIQCIFDLADAAAA
jgi:hypothetical protein